ncbi:MAG: efflux RND transporter permease subunit [Bacteroides sp.]|nr:efflux RND transporter permease subunit [Bacteroides sp.]
MDKAKSNIVEWAMTHHRIVILIVCCLMGIGVLGLSRMDKNEFPDFTIRQGIVAAVCPGYTAEMMEEQVAKPLENYIFGYKEVRKAKTQTFCQDGIAIVQIVLNNDVNNKDEFWSKFKHGISEFKPQLPSGVLAIQVIDDFGDTAALLISMESSDKTYRELNDYMDELKDELRKIEAIGRMNVYGMQQEQISVYVDTDKLSHYGFNDQMLAMTLFNNGFTTTGGRIKDPDRTAPIYITRSINSQHDVEELIVISLPTGETVRLKDVATIVKEYPSPTSYITTNGKNCLILSVEMKTGRNIVAMGEEIQAALGKFQNSLPEEVSITTITDQSKVVDDSVTNFLEELLIAILAVVVVVVLLLPWRVALVAASTIPITIFMSIGLFWAFDIGLNSVSLAALIVTLGMIVDNSIVIIDSYLELMSEGMSRWEASIRSARQFFKSILSATLAISLTFFPFLLTCSGMVYDFIKFFPWAISIVLFLSLIVAEMIVPFLQYWFIRKPIKQRYSRNNKPRRSILDLLQKSYDWLIDRCFRYKYLTLTFGVLSVGIGIYLMASLTQRLLPFAERNQFAVEIFMPTGTSLEKTASVADSLELMMRGDSRIKSIASFKGTSSPRFMTSYAPQPGGANFAQFIVNTTGNTATEELLNEMTPKFRDAFPEAHVRFKQLGYTEAVFPVEIRLTGTDIDTLRSDADKVMAVMRAIPKLNLVSSDYGEPLQATRVTLDEQSSQTLGVTNVGIETQLAMRYNDGLPVGTVWEGDYGIPVKIKTSRSDRAEATDVANEKIAVAGGIDNVPLRQIATVTPEWEIGQIVRRNGLRTLTVRAEVERGENPINITNEVLSRLNEIDLSEETIVSVGGEKDENEEHTPNIMAALMMAAALIFFILLWHFKRIRTATFLMICMSFCIFGAAVGILIMKVDFIVTCNLGLVSLMGILARNGIIMIDYALELQNVQHMDIKESILTSAKRRMRPIFLTSAAAAMGVIPMLLGSSNIWKPMGSVIFFGTLITMVFILTVMPVLYWLFMNAKFKRTSKKLQHA